MIISHKHKFIFIKTTKTAGTSIEIALSKHCGPDDVITPLAKRDEDFRQQKGYPGPQNCYGSFVRRAAGYLKFLLKGRPVRMQQLGLRFYNHISAEEIKARVPESVWNNYYKFCVVRNPWDRVVSHYYFIYKNEPRPAIADYLESDGWINKLRERSYGLYTIDGEVAVDKICYFENLADDLEEVRKHIGIPEPLELPKTKSKYRKDKRDYREILGDKEKERIAELFKDEIELHGYTLSGRR